MRLGLTLPCHSCKFLTSPVSVGERDFDRRSAPHARQVLDLVVLDRLELEVRDALS